MNKLLSNETALKIISLIVAVLMWTIVVSVQNPQIELAYNGIPIVVTGSEALSGAGMEVIRLSETSVDVKVSGRRSNVVHITSDKIHAVVDVSQISAADTYTLPVAVTLDGDNVAVSSVSLQEVSVQVDYVVNLVKSVSVKVEGAPRNGYISGTPKTDATEITVLGPQTLVKNIDHVQLRVDVTDAVRTVDTKAQVELIAKDGSVVSDLTDLTLSSYEIAVQVPVYQTKVVDVQPTFTGEVDLEELGITVTTEPVKVTIYGEESVLKNISYIETEPIAFQTAYVGAAEPLTVEPELPDGVYLKDSTTDIKVLFEYMESTEITEE